MCPIEEKLYNCVERKLVLDEKFETMNESLPSVVYDPEWAIRKETDLHSWNCPVDAFHFMGTERKANLHAPYALSGVAWYPQLWQGEEVWYTHKPTKWNHAFIHRCCKRLLRKLSLTRYALSPAKAFCPKPNDVISHPLSQAYRLL